MPESDPQFDLKQENLIELSTEFKISMIPLIPHQHH